MLLDEFRVHRPRAETEVLEINLALWGMIACSAVKMVQYAF